MLHWLFYLPNAHPWLFGFWSGLAFGAALANWMHQRAELRASRARRVREDEEWDAEKRALSIETRARLRAAVASAGGILPPVHEYRGAAVRSPGDPPRE